MNCLIICGISNIGKTTLINELKNKKLIKQKRKYNKIDLEKIRDYFKIIETSNAYHEDKINFLDENIIVHYDISSPSPKIMIKIFEKINETYKNIEIVFLYSNIENIIKNNRLGKNVNPIYNYKKIIILIYKIIFEITDKMRINKKLMLNTSIKKDNLNNLNKQKLLDTL